jgi:mono/diheme cytochrome c family protein
MTSPLAFGRVVQVYSFGSRLDLIRSEPGGGWILLRRAIPAFVLMLLVSLVVTYLKSATNVTDKVARGKYLVEGVAMCGDCHTPRTEQGQPDRSRWLYGATLDFKPAVPVPNWATIAPPLVGLPTMDESEAARLLATGLKSDGQPCRHPHPRFKMTREDSEAVVAYLESLEKKTK